LDRTALVQARRLELSLQAGKEWEARLPSLPQALRAIRNLGPGAADTPLRASRFAEREKRRLLGAEVRREDFRALGLERRFGPTLDYAYIPPEPAAALAGQGIARLTDGNPSSGLVTGFATAIAVSNHLLLTNWHVFRVPAEAEGVYAQFGYEYQGAVLQFGAAFALEPSRFFYANEELDIALVAVADTAPSGAVRDISRFLTLIPNEGKILKGHPVNMIGYPEGKPKAYVFRNNPLVAVGATTLAYLTDTDEGSSGSGAFNRSWELVALHHRAVPRMKDGKVLLKSGGIWTRDMSPEDIDWVANQGIRVSSIVHHLRERAKQAADPLLVELLAGAVDPLGAESIPVKSGDAMQTPELKLQGATVAMHFSGPVTINLLQAPTTVAAASSETRSSSLPGSEAAIRFDPDYDKRPGYLSKFLPGYEQGAAAADVVGSERRL
jgi:endonuclease G, mitochondrial